MKPTILVICASILMAALPATAQYGNYSEADMQRMMEQAQKGMMQAQQCFANIDQGAVEALANRGKALEKSIAGLCKQGKESEAEQEALAFAKELSADPDVAALRKCGEQMQGMLPELPFMDYKPGEASKENRPGICAGY